MPLTVKAAVYEQVPVMGDLAQRIERAVSSYLETLPHAEDVRRDYQRFVEGKPDTLDDQTEGAVYRWQLLQRQAQLIADREAAAEGADNPFVVSLSIE